MKTTYPKIEIIKNTSLGELSIGSFIRIKDKGIWYDIKLFITQKNSVTSWDTRRSHNLTDEFPIEFILQTVEKFHLLAYKTQHFFKVDPNLVDKEGRPMYPPSLSQEEEIERIKHFN